MTTYCVDIRERETGETVKTILETSDHDKAWELASSYRSPAYPKSKYFLDVYIREEEMCLSRGHGIEMTQA